MASSSIAVATFCSWTGKRIHCNPGQSNTQRLKPALQLDVKRLRVASFIQLLVIICLILSAAGT